MYSRAVHSAPARTRKKPKTPDDLKTSLDEEEPDDASDRHPAADIGDFLVATAR